VIQESHNPEGRILERDKGSKGVHRRGSIRSNGKIRRRLEMRREGNTIEGENLHSRFSYTPRRNCH